MYKTYKTIPFVRVFNQREKHSENHLTTKVNTQVGIKKVFSFGII